MYVYVAVSPPVPVEHTKTNPRVSHVSFLGKESEFHNDYSIIPLVAIPIISYLATYLRSIGIPLTATTV